MKVYGMVGHNPGTNRLDFGVNPDLNPDPAIFRRNFAITVLQYCKSSSSWIRQQSENMQSCGPQNEEIWPRFALSDCF